MKLNQTQASAIASQIHSDAEKENKVLYAKHAKSPSVTKRTNELWDKLKNVIQMKGVELRLNLGDKRSTGLYISRKDDIREAIAESTFSKRTIKRVDLLKQEVLIAAISCNTVEQIKKKIHPFM